MAAAPVEDTNVHNAAVRVIEECSEIQKAMTKFIRFGHRPYWNGIQYDNVRDARVEFAQLSERMIEFLKLLIAQEKEEK